jgi:hypothetical protein
MEQMEEMGELQQIIRAALMVLGASQACISAGVWVVPQAVGPEDRALVALVVELQEGY